MYQTVDQMVETGGRGGDVIFVVDEGINTLSDYRHRRKFKAGDGQEGGRRKCHGADGEDIILKVPAGTVVKRQGIRESYPLICLIRRNQLYY